MKTLKAFTTALALAIGSIGLAVPALAQDGLNAPGLSRLTAAIGAGDSQINIQGLVSPLPIFMGRRRTPAQPASFTTRSRADSFAGRAVRAGAAGNCGAGLKVRRRPQAALR